MLHLITSHRQARLPHSGPRRAATNAASSELLPLLRGLLVLAGVYAAFWLATTH
jgi:hypothetical protein